MASLSASLLASHLRIGDDEDAALLALYEGAAWDYVRAFTGHDWRSEMNEDVPDAIQAAVLLLVADSYEHRLAQGDVRLHPNPAVDRLLWPFRTFA